MSEVSPLESRRMRDLTSHAGTAAPRRVGALAFIRRARRNLLELLSPEMFARDLIHTRVLFLETFVVNRPDYIEQVMLTNQQNYIKSHFLQRLLGPLLGQGLLTSEGALWRRQRRIAAPAFQPKQVAASIGIIADAAAALVERWKQRDAPFDLCADMMSVTVEVIARTMFSADIGGDAARVGELMDIVLFGMRPSVLDLLGLPEWLPRRTPRAVKAAIAEFDTLIAGIIAARRTDGIDRGDLLAMLMAARDPETGEAMNDTQLRDEVMTVFLAGHETTANALSFAWWLLAQNPGAEARLHEEVDRVLQGRRPQAADLANLPYTRMVFEEALRLYPPAHNISRVSVQEDWMGGMRIPPGALVTISSYLTHRNPALWPDAERFDPERFTPEASAGRHRFAYLPFGAGPRICIGMSFAVAEGQIILATIAQAFSIKPVPGFIVEPVGLITLRAKNGIRVTLAPRLGTPDADSRR
jgi:cytochrome P450